MSTREPTQNRSYQWLFTKNIYCATRRFIRLYYRTLYDTIMIINVQVLSTPYTIRRTDIKLIHRTETHRLGIIFRDKLLRRRLSKGPLYTQNPSFHYFRAKQTTIVEYVIAMIHEFLSTYHHKQVQEYTTSTSLLQREISQGITSGCINKYIRGQRADPLPP